MIRRGVTGEGLDLIRSEYFELTTGRVNNQFKLYIIRNSTAYVYGKW